jgi:hypothetical protein
MPSLLSVASLLVAVASSQVAAYGESRQVDPR